MATAFLPNEIEPHHQNKRRIVATPPSSATQTPFKISELTSEQIMQHLFTATSNAAIEFPECPAVGSRIFQLGKLDNEEPVPSKFQFPGFDIRTRPPNEDEFMGSFMHVQEQRSSPFDVNVRIPSIHEYSAFSNILSMSKCSSNRKADSKSSQRNHEKAESSANHSKLLSELMESKVQSQARKKVLAHEDSIFVNIEPLLNYQPPERLCAPMWEDDFADGIPEHASDANASKLIYSQLVEHVTEEYERSNSFFFEPNTTTIPDRKLIDQLCMVLLGVETALFRLDYQQLKWSITPNLNVRMQHYYKDSLRSHVESILQTASYRSQIEAALAFLQRSRSDRKFIYSEISNVYQECLLTFQAIINDCQQHTITFMEFELEVRRVGVQLKLLKRFLLKDPLPRGYDDFNESFVHSEKDLFYMAYNRLKLNDYSEEEQKPLVARLTFGGFRCILYSLNVRLHHSRREWEQLFYQDYYFTLFFERRREIIDKLSDRLNVLHNEDYEVYSICREKKRIELKTTYSELLQYQREWNRLVEQKRSAIRAIDNRIVSERQRKHAEIYERKAKEIVEMKLKLAQRLQNDTRLRADQKQKQREYIEKLQNEIKRKQEEQHLNRLIEIEREKGFLLDSELEEKRRLINEKYELLASYPQMIGEFKTSVQIPGPQLKKAHSEREALGEQVVIEQQPSLRRPVSMGKMEEEEELSKEPSSIIGVVEQQPLQVVRSILPQVLPGEFPDLPVPGNTKAAIETANVKMEEEEDRPTISSEVPLKTAIEVCVNQVILNQLSVVNLAMANLLYTKHNIRSVFEFLRNYFLSSKGHYISELMDVAVCPASYIKLAYLKDNYFGQIDEDVQVLRPIFYRVSQDLNQKSTDLFGEINLIQQNLEMKVGFDFRALPDILKPYFSYIHLVKYMEVFAFILRLRHCVRLTEMQWKSLNNYERTLVRNRQPQTSQQWGMLKKLHHIRYLIQACLNRLQNYLFFHVIQEEFGKLDAYLKAREFEQLPDKHLNFLDRIIIRGFVNNPQRSISARLRMLFADVREFHNYVTLFCLDDIPVYSRSDIHDKIIQVREKCKQFSTILEHLMGER